MQRVFLSDAPAKDFSTQNNELFPNAPEKCPFGDCGLPVKMKKHGYYTRFFINKSFSGHIYIRRYICPVCGRTVSMLPAFCFTRIQYSAIEIMNIFYEIYLEGISLNGVIKRIKATLPIDRRHINYYKRRLVKNRSKIQYALNLISPEFIFAGNAPENQIWLKKILEKIRNMPQLSFLYEYFKTINETFISKSMIA